MSAPFQQTAFAKGEVAPNLFGREDMAALHVAASTFRNGFVRYTGGYSSRAGTKFVGFSKQTGRSYPPRMIPFQFNINQGLALEFGNFYMRVVSNGAFVTMAPVNILGISRATPAVVTTASTTGGISATPNNGSVMVSYTPGDDIGLAGGTFTNRAILTVVTTLLKSLVLNDPGVGYVPADTVDLQGGTQTTTAEITVSTTKVVGATIAMAGTGGTPGPAVVTGTTGTGTPFQAMVTIDGGGTIISVDSISVSGSYTVNPTDITAEPVTGGGLSGAELAITMGINTFTLTNPGVFTANPPSGAFSQGSTSGAGTGATFANGLFAPDTVSFSTAGSYSLFPPNPVAQASTTGQGVGATFNVVSGAVSPFDNGDWVDIENVAGMTQINGQAYVVGGVTPTTFQLFDVYDNPINSTGFSPYVNGGTAAEIFTLDTPYAETDLEFLKYVQSADVMSLCLVNQDTDTEYAPLDLARLADDNWEFRPVVAAPTISPPASISGSASAGGSVDYQYVVTAINPIDGTESIASPIATINNAVNIASTAGSISINWSAVPGVNAYNIYKASPAFGTTVPVGALFGFAGQAYGTSFVDSNVIPDFTQVPPQAKNPFARGQITGGTIDTGGSGYSTVTLTVNSATGSGAILVGVLTGGALTAIIIQNAGQNYRPGDTITVSGDGTGATATLTIGPQTGTFPGTPAYFQQRRAYGYTLNAPDTYFMSQPAAYTNFDSRIPTVDTDAITGTPWAVLVDGIQYFVQMPGGLVTLTGTGAWQLTGTGGSSLNPVAFTPSSQDAQPQAYNGCSPTVPPINIDNEILYVQSKGSIVRDLSYNYFTNIYTGSDLTLNSSHLFNNYSIVQWAWCEEPYKLMWAVRNDGILLCLTFVKPQEVAGWSRSDTQGLFKSVCSITELPVDALYTAVQRTIGVHQAYTIERMDNRLWTSVEDSWCVDAGLAYPQPTPDATLTASSRTGLGAISGFTGLVGGAGYSAATTVTVVDDNGQGPGTGAVVILTIVAGVITNLAITPGTGYTFPKFVFSDPTNEGSGASAVATLNNSATFLANAAVFANGDIGSVIRMGGGVATITTVNSPTSVVANLTSPITLTIPNTGGIPQTAASGNWSMTAPTSIITGLQYLAGATITGLYDGQVLTPVVVPANGTINLPTPATSVTLGLGFTAQLQSVYIDPAGASIQGQRKKIADVVVRVNESRDFTVGTNQPDGSIFSPMRVDVPWTQMALAEKGYSNPSRRPYNSTVEPNWTGDTKETPVFGGYGVPGQIAVQQTNPLPLNILSILSKLMPGDTVQLDEPKRQKSGNVQR